jgi:hypothetical protein
MAKNPENTRGSNSEDIIRNAFSPSSFIQPASGGEGANPAAVTPQGTTPPAGGNQPSGQTGSGGGGGGGAETGQSGQANE